MNRDDELDAEVESHLRMAIEERMARGESRDAAERAARREFGNVTHIKAVAREGAVIGIAASLALTRVLANSLFEVTPNDPATLATVLAAILLVALAAGYVPARRASRVDVLTALPQE